MSRVGKKPIVIPEKVKVQLEGQTVKAEGKLGKASIDVHARISIKMEKGRMELSRSSDEERDRSLHGMERARVNNLIQGVSEGFSKELTLVGVGYRAAVQGTKIILQLGYSHPVEFDIPAGMQVKIDKQTIIRLYGISKEEVGLTTARLRALRSPEPYKGKGIRLTGEHIVRKAGKAAVAGGKKP